MQCQRSSLRPFPEYPNAHALAKTSREGEHRSDEKVRGGANERDWARNEGDGRRGAYVSPSAPLAARARLAFPRRQGSRGAAGPLWTARGPISLEPRGGRCYEESVDTASRELRRRLAWCAARFALPLALAACSSPARPPIGTTGTINPSQPGGSGGDAGPACELASNPTTFTLPTISGASLVTLTQPSGQLKCEDGTTTFAYQLLDVNADGQPDLVVTSACDDATIGKTAWRVYLNSGTGFATTATRFALPPASATGGCANAAVSIFDLNGDLCPHYVVTSLCTDTTVGTSRWLVYPGSASGFAQTFTAYAVPAGYSSGAFAATSAPADACVNGANTPAFWLLDLNGDGRLDFVVTKECLDASVGTTTWLVYTGGAAGVAPTATRFALPTTPSVTAGAFDAIVGALSCTASATLPSFALVDLDVDGKVDLVVTEDCTQTSVGTSQWLWYRNGGQGFAASPTTITLPTFPAAPSHSLSTLAATGTCTGTRGGPTYSLADIDGDAQLELLVTRDCADAHTGVLYWDVYVKSGSTFASSPKHLVLPAALGATSASPVGLSATLACAAPAARPSFTTTYLVSSGGSLVGLTLGVLVTQTCNDPTVGDSRWLLFPASCR